MFFLGSIALLAATASIEYTMDPSPIDRVFIETNGADDFYITPGAIVKIDERASAYASYRIPLYQDDDGPKLAPRHRVTVGVRFKF
jgi:predicted porin